MGQKYGSAIFPPMIDAEEFQMLLNYTDVECVPILEYWYRLDDNAVPPVNMLRVKELEICLTFVNKGVASSSIF